MGSTDIALDWLTREKAIDPALRVLDWEKERPERGFSFAAVEPRVVRESPNSQVLMCLVAAGVGVSVVPRELQYQEEIVGLTFKPLGPHALRLTHGMAWKRGNTNPALQSLLSTEIP